MIHLTWGQIRQPEFNQALGHLVHTRMGFKTARLLQKITSAIQSEQTEADKLFSVIQEKYLEPMGGVPEGLFRIREDLSDTDKQAAQEQINEFHQTPVEINLPAVDANEIPMAELSPAELIRLGSIFGEE